MKLRGFLILNVILVVSTACKTNNDRSTSLVERDKIVLDVSEKADIRASEFIKAEDYVILETNDSCLIGGVNKLQISNDTIYLQSNKEIHIFSPTGKWLSSFSNFGQGPEEYLSITQMRIHDGKIFILDMNSQKIVSYNKNGDFLQAWRLDYKFTDFIIPDGKHFVLASANYNHSKFHFHWVNIETGKTIAQYGPYKYHNTIILSSFISFAGLYDKNLIVNTPYNMTDYLMGVDKFEPYLSFDFNSRDKIPDEELEDIDIRKLQELTRPKIDQTLKLFMGVTDLSYFTSTQDAYYLSFTLTSIRGGSHKNIVKLDKNYNQIGNLLLGFDYHKEFPYLEEYNYIWDGKIVSVRYAETLLETDEDLGLSYWKSKGLTEDSNPVVFIYTLK